MIQDMSDSLPSQGIKGLSPLSRAENIVSASPAKSFHCFSFSACDTEFVPLKMDAAGQPTATAKSLMPLWMRMFKTKLSAAATGT